MSKDNKKKEKSANPIVYSHEGFTENPMLVLENFFEDSSLNEIRHALWAWLYAALTSKDLTYNCPKERGNLLFLYYQFLELIEANYLLYKRARKDKGKVKSKDFEGL